ncbi:DUF2169 family type VI secretion system accessory protein [Variovorax paradoxus]|jgi:hypothetical protein|uniref:DUF2169 family type VI secretion system accessory protein n=1 Tax=Variovorax paradoxus TaxID=34073 RepID=UPI0029C9995E|nr:DUF2169 domain-containing protein [Variovorax paradoxus]WPH21121.1 DUF2169 domain-containing protein [Variovorax paradoxus]
MWQIDNRTPFAAERGWVRDRDGAEVWLVAVKCTFDIGPEGATEVSEAQPPVLRMPEHFGEPGRSSIKYEADLVLTKRTTDVLCVGHACAPGGSPVDVLDVGFRVGPVQKVLRVFGDRMWGALGASSPEPFVRMPLVYERAFGGVDLQSGHPERDWDWRNPVGTGFAVSRGNANGLRLPNIEYPGQPVRSWEDRFPPAGFGPIEAHWQPRASFAGSYDDHWLKTRQPLLPEDFDDRFFQCAPADQQSPEFLRGGEPVVMYRLAPGGDLRFLLPKVYLGFETRFYDGTREIHKTRKLHSVILEPDFPRVSLVWHSPLPCHFKVQKLERTIVTLKTGPANGEPALDDFDLEMAGSD